MRLIRSTASQLCSLCTECDCILVHHFAWEGTPCAGRWAHRVVLSLCRPNGPLLLSVHKPGDRTYFCEDHGTKNRRGGWWWWWWWWFGWVAVELFYLRADMHVYEPPLPKGRCSWNERSSARNCSRWVGFALGRLHSGPPVHEPLLPKGRCSSNKSYHLRSCFHSSETCSGELLMLL
jgi:hypothetical protein